MRHSGSLYHPGIHLCLRSIYGSIELTTFPADGDCVQVQAENCCLLPSAETSLDSSPIYPRPHDFNLVFLTFAPRCAFTAGVAPRAIRSSVQDHGQIRIATDHIVCRRICFVSQSSPAIRSQSCFPLIPFWKPSVCKSSLPQLQNLQV